jgi:hypothetical protein
MRQRVHATLWEWLCFDIGELVACLLVCDIHTRDPVSFLFGSEDGMEIDDVLLFEVKAARFQSAKDVSIGIGWILHIAANEPKLATALRNCRRRSETEKRGGC